uniref:Uncharacterized protein n=1 Tax=Globisporangium ultimum (strain ATCC 200006 / CBS 805.95 / DAOM BR144) TaxID=431595 RepID=K3WL59_GLOUD
MAHRMWFRLVGASGEALRLFAGSVRCADHVNTAAHFRSAVKERFTDSYLAGIADLDLRIYANRVVVDDAKRHGKEQQDLKSSASLECLGGTEDKALIVEVPKEGRPQSTAIQTLTSH